MKIIIMLLAFISLPVYSAGIDLHSHPFMKHGIGPLFQGSFFKGQSKSYKTLLKSNLTEQTLLESEINILVVALYTHPVLSLLVVAKKAIDKQIKEAEEFIKRNPSWIIARNADQARLALSSKSVFLFSPLKALSTSSKRQKT